MKNQYAIKLSIDNKKREILTTQIVMAESHENYSEFTLADGKKVMISYTLGNYEEKLSEMNFIRVHRKFLINLAYVKSYRTSREGGQVTLVNDVITPISRRKVQNFKQKINTFAKRA